MSLAFGPPRYLTCLSPRVRALPPIPVFPLQLGTLTPLHIAAALPGEEGVQIVELLLHAITDVDAEASDKDSTYKSGKVCALRPAVGVWGLGQVCLDGFTHYA